MPVLKMQLTAHNCFFPQVFIKKQLLYKKIYHNYVQIQPLHHIVFFLFFFLSFLFTYKAGYSCTVPLALIVSVPLFMLQQLAMKSFVQIVESYM